MACVDTNYGATNNSVTLNDVELSGDGTVQGTDTNGSPGADIPAKNGATLTNGYKHSNEKDLENGQGQLVTVCPKKAAEDEPLWKTVVRITGCFCAGLVFGIVLEKTRVFEPNSIRYQFIYQKWIMMKMFLAAVMVGLLCFCLMAHLPATKDLFQRTRASYYATFTTKGLLTICVGGFLLGAGMELAAACPGMVLAQVGAWVGGGQALMTVFGCLVGAFTYGFCVPGVNKYMAPKESYEKHLVDDYIKWPFAALALPFAVLLFVIIFVLEWFFPWETELEDYITNRTDDGVFMTALAWPPWIGGGVIGLLQLAIMFSVADTLGGSSSYTTVASQVLVTKRMESWSPYLTKFKRGIGNWWQVIYVLGAVVGAFISALCSGALAIVPGISLVSSFFGGFIMLFGSRLGSGCTSGHGLSGMGLLALLSFVAVAMIFVGGSTLGFFFYALDVSAGVLDYSTF